MSMDRNQAAKSRADQVRERRVKENRQNRRGIPAAGGRNTSRGGSPVSGADRNAGIAGRRTPPVFSRSAAIGTPGRGRGDSRSPRRVYYAVGASGAEMRFPSIPVMHPGWRLASGFIAVAMAALLIFISATPAFSVGEIEMQGMERVTAADIDAAAAIIGESVFEIDVNELTDQIAAAFPELTHIRLQVAFPAGVRLSAVERQPILAWKMQDQTCWIDVDGVIMPARGDAGQLLAISADSTPPLSAESKKAAAESQAAGEKETTINAKPVPAVMDMQVMTAAIQLSAQLPENSVLAYSADNGMGWVDRSGWKVYFGLNLDDFQLKMAEYQAIVKRLTKLGIHPTMISVEHVDAPFFRTK